MAIPPPRNGAVIRYAYLWREEKERGLIEARKDRPAAVVLAHKDAATGQIITFVLPITHSPPADLSVVVEIAADAKAQLGLDGERSWIVCDEINRFNWPGYDLRPVPGARPTRWEYGMLPRGLYEQAKALFLDCRKRGRAKVADRD
ncbi:growth inhibitor PemK [Magnetospirillum sp. UT-4]|uniref:growth inhibitor PemK n=1 Tax=Magnetospirillum sp. UT-4 TaxID=2681467 RepID=UPI00137DBBBE|nr:growth inhibitor PemK [Magnetospirillum sp. UT-4]CAA7623022.1 conserved hypothetical protein [Magnetospirillum sp. UT-4]